ncbi:hypothetical protein [Streptomyces sp. NPDC056844]|uniref:hypothetical protein n=1 Tax=unclassified Streptomyces TaxID=2593676 RepID=UPI003680AA83
MARSSRPRVHLLTGGPAWEERRAAPKQVGFTKKQKAARKPLNKLMAELGAAVNRQDWRAARAARSAAWDEVNKLADNLTREEREKLWKYKHRILAGEAQDRR